VGPRVDRHKLGDFAECQIFNAWLNETVSIADCVKILTRELKKSDESLREASVNAFTVLLLEIGKNE
jgi:hypothetical protein